MVAAGACAAATAADVSEAAQLTNQIRARGCGEQPGVEQALRSVPKLEAAAQHVARGESLGDALTASGYRASRATVIHVEARSGPGAVQEFLTGRFCTTVTDPDLEEIGTASRDQEVWIVVASPLDVPDEQDRPDVAARVLELTNQARAQERRCGTRSFDAVPPLTGSLLLVQAAQIHANDMAARDALTHLGRDGSSVGDRVKRVGYPWRAVAENLAEGQEDAAAVVRDWVASPEHCANLMNPNVTEMGVAFAISEQDMAHAYWAQVFATPRSLSDP